MPLQTRDADFRLPTFVQYGIPVHGVGPPTFDMGLPSWNIVLDTKNCVS